MTKFEMRLMVNCYDEHSRLELQRIFSNIEMEWSICGEQVKIQSGIKVFLLKEEDYSVDKMRISLVGELPCKIYDNNCVKDSSCGESEFYFLDDLYREDIQPPAIGCILALVLTDPRININGCKVSFLFNEKEFTSKLYFTYAIQNMAAERYGEIIKVELSFLQCWDWIKRNTSLCGSVEKSPTYISALSYLLCRELHECVVYSIIGLESIYVPRDKQAGAHLLRKRISSVFSDIQPKRIKDLYSARSKIVHGEVQLGISFADNEVLSDGDEYEDLALFSSALLIESIRLLIFNNARQLTFRETTEVQYTM